MLFFISNVALHVYQHLSEERLKMRFLRLIQSHVKASSVLLRKIHPAELSEGTLSEASPTQDLVPPECTRQLWSDDSIEVVAVEPQLHVDLKSWTSYLGTQSYVNSSISAGNCHILLEVCQPKDSKVFLDQSLSVPPTRRVKVMDLTRPIAWKSGTPFCIVAECSPEALAELGVGMKEGRLALDDMLELQCITTVSLQGCAISLLNTDCTPTKTADLSTDTCRTRLSPTVEHSLRHGNASWVNLLDYLYSILEDPAEVKGGPLSQNESNESLASFPATDQYGDVSSSQQFLAGLVAEHSQVTQLRESHCDSDSESSSVIADTAAGEAPSDSLELLAPEVLTPAHRQASNRKKPPNILVYCGKKDSSRQYEAVRSVFAQCLNPDRYTIYHLKHEQVHSTPWRENTVLLIIASEKVYDGVDVVFLDYFIQGGTVISLGSAYDAQFVEKIQISKNIGVLALCYRTWKDVTVICGRYVYKNADAILPNVSLQVLAKDKQTNRPVMIEATHDITEGVALLSQVNLDKDPAELAISPEIFAALKRSNSLRFEILRDLITQLGLDCSSGVPPRATPCYLMATDQKAKNTLMKALQPRLEERLLRARELSLLFCNHDDEAVSGVRSGILPVITDSVVTADKFDLELYKHHLSARLLGHVVFYTEVINTTMNLFEGMMFSVPENVGLITIASRQTSGQGRGGNTWLSPLGCAMFSLHVRIPVNSELGQRAAFLQHITSLAVVLAVTQKPGYESVDLRLKWPNDIYFGNTMKLGGVIVKSSIMADVIHANIGCGVNVSNADPTVCINDLVQQYNQSHDIRVSPFTVEEVIARTVSSIENLITLFQEQGKQAFLDLYYEKWLHSDAHVHLQSENKDATVIGLDNYGFLSVRMADGTVRSVHPDGNSFDMMRNLIIPKSR